MGPLLLTLLAVVLADGASAICPEVTSRAIRIPRGFSRVLFKDDFSTQTPGSQPSRAKWTYDLGTSYPGGPPNWGNNEAQSYTSSRDNVVITTARTLRITPLKVGGQWTSARIETTRANDFACPPGGKIRIETSIKLGSAPPASQMGIWPAFWALGADFRQNYDGWPGVGEVDIMESANGAPTVWQTVHCGSAPGGPCNEFTGVGGSSPFSRGRFHTVAVEIDRTNPGGNWRGEKVTWFVDGRVTRTVSGATINDEAAWTAVTRKAKFVLLNVAVGGGFPDNVANPGGARTPTSQTAGGVGASMEVRYVAVFST